MSRLLFELLKENERKKFDILSKGIRDNGKEKEGRPFRLNRAILKKSETEDFGDYKLVWKTYVLNGFDIKIGEKITK